MTDDERNPLERAEAGGEWIDALLALFWAVDAEHKGRALLPLSIEQAYEQAEAARQEL